MDLAQMVHLGSQDSQESPGNLVNQVSREGWGEPAVPAGLAEQEVPAAKSVDVVASLHSIGCVWTQCDLRKITGYNSKI